MFKEGQTKSVFTIELVPDTERDNILQVRSGFEDLREVSRIFKYNKKDALELRHLVKTIGILSKIVCFLHDQEYNSDLDYTQESFNKEPLKDRQAIMKDMGIIDILMDIVHFPFEHGFFSIEDIENPLYISKVISLCYISIKFVIRELRTNELYASQWLDMIVEYGLKDTKNILNVKETLTELIDNNEKILNAQIKDPIINRLVDDLFNSRPDDKVVRIIQVMCVCNGKPVAKNQARMTKLLLADKVSLRKVMPELWKREDTGQIVISDPWDLKSTKKINLKDLKTMSQELDNGRYYDFFMSMIDLMVDLCLGRNYTAINILTNYYPLDLLIDIICDRGFTSKIRTAMIKLIEVLYIDVFPYQDLQIPYLIRVFDSAEANTGDLSLSCSFKSSEDSGKLQGLTSFVLDIINCPLDMLEISEAAELYTAIVELCRKMIKLGYFKKYSDIKAIYNGIMLMVSANWDRETSTKDFNRSKTSFKGKDSADSNKGLSMSMKSEDIQFQSKVNGVKMALCKILLDLLYVEADFQITKTVAIYRNLSSEEDTPCDQFNQVQTIEVQSLLDPENIDAAHIHRGKHGDERLKKLFTAVEKKVLLPGSLVDKKPHLTNFLIENTLSNDKELKDFSLKLLQEMYTVGKRLFQYMQMLLVIDSDQEKTFYSRATEIQKLMFKLFENMPNWYNNHNRLSMEYHQAIEIAKRIEEDFKDARKFTLDRISLENIQMSACLFDLAREHLFVNIHLQKMLESLPQFYQNLLDKTGIIDHALKMITYMVGQLHNDEEKIEAELMAENKVLLNELILLICKTTHDNTFNKMNLLPYIDGWLKSIILYNSLGMAVNIQKPKNFMNSPNKKQGSPQKHREGSSIKYMHDYGLDDQIEDGDLPFMSNIVQLVIQVLRNSKEVLKDFNLVSSIAHSLIEILCKSRKRTANFYLMAQVMHALEEMVCERDMPIRANQSLVIKLLAERNKEGVLYFYQNTTIYPTVEVDLQLPSKIEEMDNTPVHVVPSKLCMDLAFLSLIGMCTFEKNEYAERIAQSFIPPK